VEHVRVLLDDHQLRDLHRPELGHSSDVVAPQVDEHDVLGTLLLIGEQLGTQRGILGGREPAAARPGDRRR